ncbi:hypothetical protein pb186bvf_012909 [Paramecium bursaria]
MIYDSEQSVPNYLLCCICLQISKIPAVCWNCSSIQCHNCCILVNKCVYCNKIIDFYRHDHMIYSLLNKTACKCEYCGKEIKYHRFQRHQKKCQDIHDFIKPVQSQFYALQKTLQCFSCQQLALSPYGCQKCDQIYCYVCMNNFRRLKNNCCNQTEFYQAKEVEITNCKIVCIHCNLITDLKSATHHLKICSQKPKNYLDNHTIESLRNVIFREGLLFYKQYKQVMSISQQKKYDIRFIMAELYKSEKNIKLQKTQVKNIMKRKQIYEQEKMNIN